MGHFRQATLAELISDTLKCFDTIHELRKKFIQRTVGPSIDTYNKEKALLRSCEVLLCEVEEMLRENETPHTRQLIRAITSYPEKSQ